MKSRWRFPPRKWPNLPSDKMGRVRFQIKKHGLRHDPTVGKSGGGASLRPVAYVFASLWGHANIFSITPLSQCCVSWRRSFFGRLVRVMAFRMSKRSETKTLFILLWESTKLRAEAWSCGRDLGADKCTCWRKTSARVSRSPAKTKVFINSCARLAQASQNLL